MKVKIIFLLILFLFIASSVNAGFFGSTESYKSIDVNKYLAKHSNEMQKKLDEYKNKLKDTDPVIREAEKKIAPITELMNKIKLEKQAYLKINGEIKKSEKRKEIGDMSKRLDVMLSSLENQKYMKIAHGTPEMQKKIKRKTAELVAQTMKKLRNESSKSGFDLVLGKVGLSPTGDELYITLYGKDEIEEISLP